MDALFEIKLDLPNKGSRRAAQILYLGLKSAILDGRLGAGIKLPVSRDSLSVFGVSRNTLAEVYRRLLRDGLVAARRGSGTYVTPRAAVKRQRRLAPVPDKRLNEFWLRADITAAMDFWRDQPAAREAADFLDFRPALIDTALFPLAVFRRVTLAQLRRLEKRPASFKSPQGNQGHYPLRQAIAQHIVLTRAVVSAADDILVTAGAQQAFDLLARVLVTAQKTVVAIEDPGYPPMRVPFAAAGARLHPVPVDAEGIRVDMIPDEARIICVCPSHQFPTGVSMSPERRRQLIAFARRHSAVILEDDYDGEFRYEGSPLEALRAAGAEDVVFYVGTFSKCMWPALRLGFIVAPPWALRTLIAAKNALDWHCPTPLQMGVARFISEGHLTRHVGRLRRIYARRRAALLAGLTGLSAWLEPIPSCYGLHVAARGHAPLDWDRLAAGLLKSKVKLHAMSRYFMAKPTLSGLIFGLGSVDVDGIGAGLESLRRALPKK